MSETFAHFRQNKKHTHQEAAGLTLHRFVDYLPKNMALMVRTMQIDLSSHVQKNMDDHTMGKEYDRPTIIQTALASDLRPEDKTHQALMDRALVVLSAGAETTSWALTVMIYNLLSHPDVLERLTEELKEAIDDPHHLPSWATLEKLPYLDAVIHEGLRLSCMFPDSICLAPEDFRQRERPETCWLCVRMLTLLKMAYLLEQPAYQPMKT